MATSNIDIKIRALIEGLKDVRTLMDQLQGLGQQAKNSTEGLRSSASGVGGLGTEADKSAPKVKGLAFQLDDIKAKGPELASGFAEMRSGLGSVSDGFSTVIQYAKGAAVAYAGFLAIRGAKELAEYAARTETLGVTLKVVGENAGYSQEELDKYETSLKKMGISTQSARESMTAMIQAGLPLGPQAGQSAANVSKLARASQDLAVVTGENSSETFRRLITNIQQMDTMGLRFMGITTDIAAAQDRYAASIGKSAGALSQQQKVLAVNNAVLAEAAKMEGAYELSMDTVGKKAQSLKRYQEELANAMGEKLLPAYGAVVDGATKLLKTLEKLATATDPNKALAEAFGDEVRVAVDALSSSIERFAGFVAENASLVASLGTNLVGLVGDLFKMIDVMGGVTEETGTWQAILWTAALAMAGLRDGMKLMEAGFLTLLGVAAQTVGSIAKGWGMLFNLFGENSFGRALEDIGDSFNEMAKKSYAANAKIVDDFANGKTATKEFLDGVEKADAALSKMGKSSSLDSTIKEIRELQAAQRDGKGSSLEHKEALERLTAKVKEFGDAGADTKKVNEAFRLLGTVANKVSAEYEEALKNMGTSADELRTGVSTKFSEITGAMQKLAANGQTTAAVFAQAFSKNIDTAKTTSDIAALGDALAEARQRGQNLVDTGNLQDGTVWLQKTAEASNVAAKQFDKVFDTSLKAAQTEDEFIRLQQEVVKFGDQSGRSIEWISSRLEAVGVSAKLAGQSLENSSITSALSRIGITAEEMRGQASQNIQLVVSDLQRLRSEAKVTGDDYYNAFSKAVDMSKTIGDLGLFRKEVKASLESGKIDWQEYQSSIELVDKKFTDLFAKQLSTANTKEALSQLVEQANRLKSEGAISAEALAVALQLIANKANGGTAEVARLAEASAKLAEKGAAISNAQKNSIVAGLETQKKKNALLDAENKYRETGLEVDKAGIAVAKANVEASLEKQSADQISLELRTAEYQQQAAQSVLADAELANKEKGTAASQLALQSAKQQADQTSINVSRLREQAAIQDSMVSSSQAAAAQAEADADEVKRNVADTSKTVRTAQVDIASFIMSKWKASADEQKHYIQKFSEEYNKQLAANDARRNTETNNETHFLRLKQAENIALRVSKEYAIQRAEQDRMAAKEEERLKGAESQAKIFNDQREVVADTARLAELGLTGLTKGGDALTRAYYEAKIQAAEAAKAVQDSASSFIASATGIHEELLAAQGKEDEVTRSRYETRKAELAIQYQQLQLQIQIARVQAQAAGISTVELDKAAAQSSAAYDQAVSDLGKLEAISLEGIRKKKAEEKAAQQEAAKTGNAQAGADTGVNKALEERQTLLEKERALRSGILSASLSDAVSGASSQFSSNISAIASQQPASGVELRTVDVSKFVLEIGDRQAEVYTKPGEGADLWNLLEDLKRRSAGG